MNPISTALKSFQRRVAVSAGISRRGSAASLLLLMLISGHVAATGEGGDAPAASAGQQSTRSDRG